MLSTPPQDDDESTLDIAVAAAVTAFELAEAFEEKPASLYPCNPSPVSGDGGAFSGGGATGSWGDSDTSSSSSDGGSSYGSSSSDFSSSSDSGGYSSS